MANPWVNDYLEVVTADGLGFEVPISWIGSISVDDDNSKAVAIRLISHTNTFTTIKGTLGAVSTCHSYDNIAGRENIGDTLIPLDKVRRITFTDQELKYSRDFFCVGLQG